MAGYFNTFHFIAMAILALLAGLFILLARRESPKIFSSIVIVILCATVLAGVMTMIVVDRYTKSAVIENVQSQRVLRNETIVFRGTVRNTGLSSVANCNLVIKLINNPTTKDDLVGENVFKPTGWSLFSWLNGSKKDDRPNTVEYKFSIAKNLKPREYKSFYTSMPYPPYFTKTQTITKVECY